MEGAYDSDHDSGDEKTPQVDTNMVIPEFKTAKERRHDLAIVLGTECNTDIADAMVTDLKDHGFDCTLVECDKGVASVRSDLGSEYVVLKDSSGATLDQKVVFVAYKNTDTILREAQNLKMRKYKRPDDQDVYDREKSKKQLYLDPKIIKYEEKKFFDIKDTEKYEGGTFETILSEAEISL